MNTKAANTTPEQDSPFHRFQNLLHRLLAVPKKELDEKLAEFKARPRKKRVAS